MIHTFFMAVNFLYMAVFMLTGLAGLVGTALVLFTREDAFGAADRQPKTVWAAMLALSSIVLLIPLPGLTFLTWVGAVVIGIYWFDVRPQLRDIINGNYSW